jgi:hypothetical protein
VGCSINGISLYCYRWCSGLLTGTVGCSINGLSLYCYR